MKKTNTFLNIVILFVLNALLILFDYYVGIELFKIISDEWYILVLLFFASAVIINPYISYLIDYYILIKYI